MSMSKISISTDLTTAGNLENYQRFKIMGGMRESLKKIFGNHVFVGTNMFSTALIEEDVNVETTKPFLGR